MQRRRQRFEADFGARNWFACCWGYHRITYFAISGKWKTTGLNGIALKFGKRGKYRMAVHNMSQPVYSATVSSLSKKVSQSPSTERTLLVLLEVHCRKEIVLFDACLTPNRHPLHSLRFTQDTKGIIIPFLTRSSKKDRIFYKAIVVKTTQRVCKRHVHPPVCIPPFSMTSSQPLATPKDYRIAATVKTCFNL